MAKQVIIFGCGPAGMLAAHAVALSGHEPIVVTAMKERSPIPGATFLHEAIPGVTPREPDGIITFQREGSRAGYAEKVYGSPDAPCSWDSYDAGDRPAWSMFDMYERLWSEYSDQVVGEIRISPTRAAEFVETFPLVISTIPANHLCTNAAHQFKSQRVFISDKAWRECPDDTIIYNGEKTISWYRTSVLFGHEGSEFGAPAAGARPGFKPLSNDCDCCSDVVRVGRFGKWTRGVLVNHAFKDAMDAVEERLGVKAL